ncbi:hypothetical protein [Bradyrhizobium sp. LVM 105]|uniref:hypothetical protein n=1 Tax=Bradyrhizobium sp. LVM 105 TaxID=2341115 RepID=UPI001FDEDA13|nr:hypothetical protein [Bradyrhizobium sp. LVM 105]
MTSPVGAMAGAGRNGVVAARHLARWLSLAATPTFAIMAVLTAMAGGGPADMLCAAGQGSLLGGMVPMYLLMSAFHSAAWLRLMAGRRTAAGVNASSFETRARARSSG